MAAAVEKPWLDGCVDEVEDDGTDVDDDGRFLVLLDSGVYLTCPSRMLDIVWSTLLVLTETIQFNFYGSKGISQSDTN